MRHIISILLQNEAGALARVANMFSARGYNIDSLSVAPTHDATVSRLTLVTQGSDQVVQQIVAQTRKLIDVVEIADLTSSDHIECELAMVKLRLRGEDSSGLVEAARSHRAYLIDEGGQTRTLRLAGTGQEIDEFIAALSRHGEIVELVRSGVAALGRGNEIMALPQGA